MIVKNAEETLPRLLDTIKENPVFDQVFILDTGSTDGTLALLEKYPFVQTKSFEWTNNFSDARNESLSNMTTDVFMWLDADDVTTVETLDHWKRLAGELYESDANSYLLPYHYSVNAFDEPVLKQFRERILKNPRDWVWREPVHEVCCFLHENVREVTIDDAPVVHKPIHDEYRANKRNWNILHSALLNSDDVSPRTLYYLQREAMGKGQFEYAISLVKQQKLVNSDKLSGWLLYEVAKLHGEAYRELYFQTRDKSYRDKGITVLETLINDFPDFNEARASLIELYLRDMQPFRAIEVAETLVEDVPHSPAAILLDKYGGYKDATLAAIHLKALKNPRSAFHFHLNCLEKGYLTEEVFENDRALRRFIRFEKTAIVYADHAYLDRANEWEKLLIDERIENEVWVSCSPLAKSFSDKSYYHITDDESTLYKDETPSHTFKSLLWMNNDAPEAIYGYDRVVLNCYQIPLLEIAYKLNDVYASRFASLEDMLRQAKATTASWFSSIAIDFPSDTVIEKSETRGKVKLYVTRGTSDLVSIVGATDLIVKFGVANDTLFVPSLNDIEIVEVDVPNGIPFRLSVFQKGKSVAFFAGGIEEWDGLTPYMRGIGGSESSLIYVSEQLAQLGYEVTVFCPTSQKKIVNGVSYIPQTWYDQKGGFDLFVSSRIPSVLKTRQGKKQCLWLHDTMDAYKHKLEKGLVIDHFICISEWQKATALKIDIPEHKIVTLPNGVHQFMPVHEARKPNRTVWLSSPDRGLHNVIKIQKKYPELFDDYWVLYSWHNINVVNEDNFYVFCRTIKEKNYLRKNGVKLVGRLPIDEVKALLGSSERWVYPSSFEETFCISAVEALIAGVECFINRNGAVYETAKKTACPKTAHYQLPTGSTTFEDDDIRRWIRAIKNPQGPTNHSLVKLKPNVLWKDIAKEWDNILLL